MEKAKVGISCSGAIGYSGWKYYNIIKKKAIGHIHDEYSWSGLMMSVAIAFFICIGSASCLSVIYKYTGDSEKMNYYKEESLKIKHQGIGSAIFNKFPGLSDFTAIRNFWIFAGSVNAVTNDYEAKTLHDTFIENLTSGNEGSYELKIKNTGQKTWKKENTYLETGPFLKTISKVRHEGWLNFYQLSQIPSDIKPGETSTIKIKLRMPATVLGMIQENFQLVNSGYPVQGSLTRFFITIDQAKPASSVSASSVKAVSAVSNSAPSTATVKTSGADFCAALSTEDKKSYAQCNTASVEKDASSGISEKVASNPAEPILRIGLYYPASVQRVSYDSVIDVISGAKNIFAEIPANQAVSISYDSTAGVYKASFNGKTLSASDPIRLVPRVKNSIATLMDFDSRPKWNTYYNDNLFKNIIEFNYSKTTKRLWVINELPIGDYLKGMAETSNYSPSEFQKVLITAARTYAMYHYNRGKEYKIADGSTKHADEHYHLDANYDQVYRGYNSEKRMPVLSKAVDETEGI